MSRTAAPTPFACAAVCDLFWLRFRYEDNAPLLAALERSITMRAIIRDDVHDDQDDELHDDF